MYGQKNLSKVYESSKEILFDNHSKIVIMSDCHRGDGSYADNFSKNKNIYFAALSKYLNKGYIYIELGDGDELWENNNIDDIIDANLDTFSILSEFYKRRRLYFIFGNHDMIKKEQKYVKENLCQFLGQTNQDYITLFDNIKVHEGLILKHKVTKEKIFLVHGHQVSFLDYKWWKARRFLVGKLWKHLELFGINDPTSPAKNYSKRQLIDKRIIKWVKDNKQMLIAGHTHKPIFPEVNDIPYFNDGSCVHPTGITAIEISNGFISLVKWEVKSKTDGTLFVGREVISGPENLKEYFKLE
ncbi:metallophosphoesterase [Senegalia massiliensis]|uniref:metallophosphoesterase n=1 Tax=Senegalia massiliensis TaxID=1720316 RepID=UPI00102FFE30|nr:metallophosphoesterase [Senegalia massiliensis]